MTTCITNVCGTGNSWTGPLPGDPDNNSVLSAVATFGGIDVSWTYPTTNPHAVAHTLLYRGVTSDFANAGPAREVAGSHFFDKITVPTTYYYWIQIVSVNGTVGATIGPATATPKTLIEDLMGELTSQIDSGTLATSLRNELDQISTLNTNLANEITDREGGETTFAAALLDVQNGIAEAHTFIENATASFVSANEAMAESVDLLAVTLGDDVAAVVTSTSAWITEVDDTVTDIGALYHTRLTVNGLVGGFGVYNSGATVEAGFDVDTFWVGRTNADKVKPFIISGGVTYIDEALINKLTFTKLKDSSGNFIVEGGLLKTSYIDTKGMVIRDAGGTPVFSAGTGLNWSYLTGLPAFAPSNADQTSSNVAAGISGQGGLATSDYVSIGSTVRFPGGAVMQTADFVNSLSRINSGNIGTFMDAAAIGTAYIGNLAVTNAKIGNLEVGTHNIQLSSITGTYFAESSGSSTSVVVTVPTDTSALLIFATGGTGYRPAAGEGGDAFSYPCTTNIVAAGSTVAAASTTAMYVANNPAAGTATVSSTRTLGGSGSDYYTTNVQLAILICKR